MYRPTLSSIIPFPAGTRLLLIAAALLGLWVGTAAADDLEPPDAPPAPAEDFSKPMGPPDPYNRGTPRGSVYGYITACRAGDYERAAAYLDLRRLPAGQRERGPELARRLKTVLDQTLWIDYVDLSDRNAGAPDDGVKPWQDRLGEIELDGRPIAFTQPHGRALHWLD